MDKKATQDKEIKKAEPKIEQPKKEFYSFCELDPKAQFIAMSKYRDYDNIPVEEVNDTFLRNRMLSDLDTHFTKDGEILALVMQK